MSKKIKFSDDIKKYDGKKQKSIEHVLNTMNGCLKHPGCMWSTPCDCTNCEKLNKKLSNRLTVLGF
jgi:hypothetical protein